MTKWYEMIWNEVFYDILFDFTWVLSSEEPERLEQQRAQLQEQAQDLWRRAREAQEQLEAASATASKGERP